MHLIISLQLRNTFQCVLAIDGQFSFVIFLYDKIQWPNDGFNPAVAGINGGDGVRGVNLPGSFSPGILNLLFTSSIEMTGLWVFWVDRQNVIQPTDKGIMYH